MKQCCILYGKKEKIPPKIKKIKNKKNISSAKYFQGCGIEQI